MNTEPPWATFQILRTLRAGVLGCFLVRVTKTGAAPWLGVKLFRLSHGRRRWSLGGWFTTAQIPDIMTLLQQAENELREWKPDARESGKDRELKSFPFDPPGEVVQVSTVGTISVMLVSREQSEPFFYIRCPGPTEEMLIDAVPLEQVHDLKTAIRSIDS